MHWQAAWKSCVADGTYHMVRRLYDNKFREGKGSRQGSMVGRVLTGGVEVVVLAQDCSTAANGWAWATASSFGDLISYEMV